MVNKFKLLLEGVPYEIERKGDLILVNGLEFSWSVNGSRFAVGGNSHTVEVRGKTATVDGIAYQIEPQGLEVAKPGRPRKAASAPPDVEDIGTIVAIMPGLIVKLVKQEGDHVETGDVVLVLEAMKMQNELPAKRAGTIKKIVVKVGETVEMRQVLAVIEG